jgi:acyl carrier protein
VDKEQIAAHVVAGAIGELNLQLGAAEQLPLHGQAALFGSAGPLDSLGLVQLIAELENRIEAECGHRVNLADDELLGEADGPFAHIEALIAHVRGVI